MLACWHRCYRNNIVKKAFWPCMAWNLFLRLTQFFFSILFKLSQHFAALTGWVHSCCPCTTRTWVGSGSDTTAPSRSPGLTADTRRSQTCHIWCCQTTGKWCGFCLPGSSAGWVQPFECGITESFYCTRPRRTHWCDQSLVKMIEFSN